MNSSESPNQRATKRTTSGTGIVSSTLAALYALPAGADIIHNDTGLPTATTNNGGITDISWDVDGAFGVDFAVTTRGFGPPTIVIDSDGRNGQGMVQLPPNAGADEIRNLASGVNVGPTLSAGYVWGPGNQDSRTFLVNSSIVSANADGFVFGDNFIGFRFDAGPVRLYGWARINLVNNGGGSASLTVAEWAYEDSGAAVRVGDTGSTPSAPEPHSLALLAMGAGGLAAWRRRRSAATPPQRRAR